MGDSSQKKEPDNSNKDSKQKKNEAFLVELETKKNYDSDSGKSSSRTGNREQKNKLDLPGKQKVKKKKSSQFKKNANADYLESWAEPNNVFESDDEDGNLENAVQHQKAQKNDSSDSEESGLAPIYRED